MIGSTRAINPFAGCDVIVFQGGATLFDRQLASTIHCVDDEIVKCLKRRERDAGATAMPRSD